MGTLADAEVVGLSSFGEREVLRKCRFCGSREVQRQTRRHQAIDLCFRFVPHWSAGSDRSLNAPVLRAGKPALLRSAAQLNLAF